ncbi:MAG: hypothetical protein GXO83_09255 [Chlorobi bacterium]|nr:hypothetical protein [Chlorobiota bacterium]
MVNKMFTRAVFLAFLSMFLFGCKSGNQKQPAEESEITVDVSELNQDLFQDINEAKQIFYSLPSPLETAMLIRSAGAIYDEDLLNNVDNSGNYTTNKSMALNLGIYTCDLSFASLYDQTQASISYMNAAKKMADGLGILDAINDETIERLEENINNRDVIMDIISETFMNSSSYLKENDRTAIAAIVLVGGWVEGLYLATQMVPDSVSLKNNKLVDRIVDQKLSLDIVMRLLADNSDNPDVQSIQKDIDDLKAIFDKIIMKTSSNLETSVDTATDVTTIKSQTQVTLTPEVFKELKKKVEIIRSNYIS